MNKSNKKLGFTLIEILVVVAIIGILMGIAVDYLSSAKSKGSGAGVKQNLNSLRTDLPLYQTVSGTNLPCNIAESVTANSNAKKIWDQAKSRSGGKWGYSIHGCNANNVSTLLGTGFIFIAKIETGKYWCVDSTNAGKIISSTVLPLQPSPPGFTGGGSYTSGNSVSYLCP